MIPSEHQRNLHRAERIAERMDAAVRIPGTGFRIGYDSLLGLVPGIGDTLALAPSAYILKLAHDSGAPSGLVARMGVNIAIDWLLGLVPLVGDIFDVGWKANLRNATLLRAYLERAHGTGPRQDARLRHPGTAPQS